MNTSVTSLLEPASTKTAARLVIGVMGSSGGVVADEARQRVYQLGAAIAQENAILITGACPGLPHDAVRGARDRGGLVVGVSPGLSRAEHRGRYGSPTEGFDLLVYTGSGLMGREITSIRSCDIVIIAGGRTGTLGELAIAYDEGRLIGVLTGTGGVADLAESIFRALKKDTGACVVYDADPVTLVRRVLHIYRTSHFQRPSCFCDATQQR